MTETSPARVARPDVPLAPPAAKASREVSGAWFTLPYLVAFVVLLLGPTVALFFMSFTDLSLTGSGGDFVGVDNYTEAFTDPNMWSALGNTLFFTVLTTVPLVVVSLVMAVLVATGLPGQWLWRLSYFAPFLLASSVVTALWGWIYQPGGGLATGVLGWFGIEEVGWLTEEGVAMWSIALTTLWWTVGFNFLLYLAAIQAIPEHLYEAALLDGAGPLRRLWSVTLPMLRRTTRLILMLQLIASLKVFDQIYLLTQGGPNGATRPILEYIYDTAFTGYRFGYAAAISFICLALVIGVSAVSMLRRTEES